MVTASVFLALALAGPEIKTPICPIMGHGATDAIAVVEYASFRYEFCCNGCPQAFAKSPDSALKKAPKEGILGTSLFDPVARQLVTKKTAQFVYTVGQNQFLILHEEANEAWKANPKQYQSVPAKVVMQCPVTETKFAKYSDAFGYCDYQGVRYFVSSEEAQDAFDQAPAKYATKFASEAKAPKAILVQPPKK